jgi:heptosyltransferase-2
MSAIGDTIMTAQIQDSLCAKGYAPILLTHKSNTALLECMPRLQGACLWSDGNFEFFTRSHPQAPLLPAAKKDFAQWLRSQLRGAQRDKFFVLDLQRTGRSKRAIRHLRKCLGEDGIKSSVQSVRKGTFWRILLILWAYVSLRQWFGRTPPQWLKSRLISVHQRQAKLVEALPSQSHGMVRGSANPPPLLAPEFRPNNLGFSYVVFAVGASARLKAWPREHFRVLIKLILENSDAQVCLCGGSADQALGEYLTFGQDQRVVNLIGKTSLTQTLGLIQNAAYVVTGDSFASHVCDLMGVPASVIFGATHPKLGFAPNGSHILVHHSELSCSPCSRHGQGECRFKNVRCLTSVKPEQVFVQIKESLTRRRQPDDSCEQLIDS